jgi:hypothetical protein
MAFHRLSRLGVRPVDKLRFVWPSLLIHALQRNRVLLPSLTRALQELPMQRPISLLSYSN